LRSYSAAFDMRRLDPRVWVTNGKHCWDIGYALEEARHYPLISTKQEKSLRLRDKMEREAGKLRLHPPPKTR